MIKGFMLGVVVMTAAAIMFTRQASADHDKRNDWEYIGRAGACQVYTKVAGGTRVFVAVGGTAVTCSIGVD